jgi:RNAse (barnase) inhibitor barstar
MNAETENKYQNHISKTLKNSGNYCGDVDGFWNLIKRAITFTAEEILYPQENSTQKGWMNQECQECFPEQEGMLSYMSTTPAHQVFS